MRRAEKVRMAMAQELTQIVRHAPAGFARVALDGRFLWANTRLYDLLGAEPAQTLSLNFRDVMIAQDPDWAASQLERLLAGEIDHYVGERHCLRLDNGRRVPVLCTVTLAPEVGDEPAHLVCVVQDLDEIKAARPEAGYLVEWDIPAQTGPLPHKEAFFTMPVTKPCFGVAYREEPLAEGDLKRELLLDMLGDLVVGGLTKLYRRLYDEALVNPEFSGDFIAVRGACTVAFTGESDTPRQVVDLLQEEIERMRREGVDPEVFMLVKNQMYGELLGDVEAVDDAAEEAAAACLKGRTLADEIAALAALTVEDANALLQTALREENRAYVQIDPAE